MQLALLRDGWMNGLMDDEFSIVSPQERGTTAHLPMVPWVVSLPCIVEILPPTTKVACLDYNEVEWMVPKRNLEGGIG